MIRNLKALGLALLAVFAMSAVAASGAMAQEQTTIESDGSFTLTGTDHEEVPHGFAFQEGEENEVECHGHYEGEATGGGPLSSPATSVTVHPTYTNCTFAKTFPATVTTDGCDYDLALGKTTVAEEEAEVSASVTCDSTGEGEATEKDKIEIHIYLSKEAQEADQPLCTITVEGANTGDLGNGKNQNLSGARITDEGNGHLTLKGAVKGVEGHKEGVCGEKDSTTGELHLAATIEGKDEKNNATELNLGME